MNGETARGLVPPRPNLGPEPWRDPAEMPWWLPGLAMAASVLLVILWAWRRRRSPGAEGRDASTGASSDSEPGPRGRLVSLSEMIRQALTARFGSSFRAKTTEELSDDEGLVQLLGDGGFRDLMQLLDRVDRIKFAPEGPADQDEALSQALGAWESLASELAARIRTAPRPRPEPARRRRPGRTGHGEEGGDPRPHHGSGPRR